MWNQIHQLREKKENPEQIRDILRKKLFAEYLPNMRFQGTKEVWENFRLKFEQMGGLAEVFVEGAVFSPSGQGIDFYRYTYLSVQITVSFMLSTDVITMFIFYSDYLLLILAVISKNGEVRILSTHEQVMGGPDGQIYQGCK